MSAKTELVQLMGLWIKKDAKGHTFLAGRLGSSDVLIFRNNFKTKPEHPDYRIYLKSHDFSTPSADPLADEPMQEIDVLDINSDDVPF